MMIRMLLLLITCCVNSLWAQQRHPHDDGRIIRIPIVFHVMHNRSGNDDVPDERILNELADLNRDFMGENDRSMIGTSIRHLVGIPNIQFYLLDSAFAHSATHGIEHIVRGSRSHDELEILPLSTLNVFISNDGNFTEDNVNLLNGDVGRAHHVLTHETGHWLGLYHIWGKINGCGFVGRLFGDHDDEIQDTHVSADVRI